MNANDTENKLNLPPAGLNVMVQCKGFRCLAHRTPEGKWVSAFGEEELKDIVYVFPWEEAAIFVVPVISSPAKPRSSRVPIRIGRLAPPRKPSGLGVDGMRNDLPLRDNLQSTII